MATGRRFTLNNDLSQALSDAGRELFEACRTGDLSKVKKVVTTHNVNAKDTAGRKSSPLHFAAGELEEQQSTPRFSFSCVEYWHCSRPWIFRSHIM